MIHLCNYGCGNTAIYFKLPSQKTPNGRYMCSTSPNSCPSKRNKTIGDNNPSKRPEVRQKISKINSVLFATGSTLREKCKNTIKERYGVDNPMSIPEVVEDFVNARKAKGNYKWSLDNNDPVIKAKRAATAIKNGRRIDPELKDPFSRYEQEVDRLTAISYKKFKNVINPTNLKRGRIKGTYQLDHIVSKIGGFKLNIEPADLAHPANLRMLSMEKNISKSSESHYTKEQLLSEIKKFNKSREQLFDDVFRNF